MFCYCFISSSNYFLLISKHLCAFRGFTNCRFWKEYLSVFYISFIAYSNHFMLCYFMITCTLRNKHFILFNHVLSTKKYKTDIFISASTLFLYFLFGKVPLSIKATCYITDSGAYTCRSSMEKTVIFYLFFLSMLLDINFTTFTCYIFRTIWLMFW